MSGGVTLWRYRRQFRLASHRAVVTLRSRTNGLFSDLTIDGIGVAADSTPVTGLEAVRNHRLETTLPDGSSLLVEAGYISALNTAIAVYHDGTLVHESHPGRTIAYPEKYRDTAVSLQGNSVGEAIGHGWKEGIEKGSSADGVDFGAMKRNVLPISVDIALGLLFFVIAKTTDLTTAAIVGAAAGLVLLAIQRLTRIDLLGGLALFGIAIMLLSAALAWMFQSEEAIKYRTTVVGLTSATLFLVDGTAGGRRLARRLMLYLPYSDIDAGRLGIGMGTLGIVMAGANYGVATLASTDVWLFYSTFVDFVLTMMLIILVFRYARGALLPELAPRYRADGE